MRGCSFDAIPSSPQCRVAVAGLPWAGANGTHDATQCCCGLKLRICGQVAQHVLSALLQFQLQPVLVSVVYHSLPPGWDLQVRLYSVLCKTLQQQHACCLDCSTSMHLLYRPAAAWAHELSHRYKQVAEEHTACMQAAAGHLLGVAAGKRMLMQLLAVDVPHIFRYGKGSLMAQELPLLGQTPEMLLSGEVQVSSQCLVPTTILAAASRVARAESMQLIGSAASHFTAI